MGTVGGICSSVRCMSLYNHQQKIIDEDLKRTGLFLGTGSGKTRTALLLAKGRTLVVCPKQQREDRTWQKESARIDVEEPTVISKEEFRRDYKTIGRFDTVIFDECHEGILGATPSVKWVNRKPVPKTSQLFERAMMYLEATQPDRVYLVTATPTRSPMAVWAAGVLLGAWNMSSFYEFRDIYYIKLPIPGRQVYSPRKDRAAKERLGRTVRKIGYTGRLEDYFDVPNQTYRDVHLGLTGAQAKALLDVPLLYPDPLVGTQKEYQVENGFLIDDDEVTDYPELITDKVLDYYEEFGRVFVVMMYTRQIEKFAAVCEKKKIPHFVLTGATKDRKELMEAANKAEQGIVIAQAQVTSGYELPTYPVVVFASVSHRIVDYIQAQGRVQRANAIKKNLYIHLITGDQSEARLESLKNKEDFHEATYAKKRSHLYNKISEVGKEEHPGAGGV